MGPSASHCTVLYVDDDPAEARLLSETLRELALPANLEWAEDGEKAWAWLAERERALPQLVLLSLGLPKSGGLELLSRIKQDAAFRTVPVAVFSASLSHQDALEAYNRHANCCVDKPLDLDQLLVTIRSLVTFWCQHVATPSNRAAAALQ